MDQYLQVDRLGQTLKKLMIEQVEQQVTSDYLIWFKKEDKVLISKNQLIIESYQFLRYSLILDYTMGLLDLAQYKDKYGDYMEIQSFKSVAEPLIIPIKANNWIIIHKKKKLQFLYHFSINLLGKSKIVLLGKYSLQAQIYKDKYLELFYIVKESDQKLHIYVYHVNDYLMKIEKLQESKYSLLHVNKQIDYITHYNKNILLLFTQRTGVILYQNSCTYQTIALQKQKRLYYYSQFLYTETVLLMIETDKNELILLRNKIEVLRQLSLNFQISLDKILALNLEQITKLFLLDLIQELPSIQEFCMWDSNDFEVVKLLIVGLQSTEQATSAIIYCLKYYPVFVIGIVKYLEYYCFLIEQDFKQLIGAVFELIPGYLISNNQQEIKNYPKYRDYLQQYNIYYNNQMTDSQCAWYLLCNQTDNQHLKI